MSMFRQFQLNLRNAVRIAKSIQQMTEENYQGMLAVINLLDDRRFDAFGLGEDVSSLTVGITRDSNGFLVVDAGADTAGVATFALREYPYALVVEDVVLQGVGLTWTIEKTYPDQSPAFFDQTMLPLLTDNVRLRVTIAPGGRFEKAVVQQRITML